MAASKVLLTFLLSFLLVVMLVKKVESQTQSTIFFFNNFTPNNPRLTYEGDAHVPPDTAYARLVQGRRPYLGLPSAGRVLFNSPVTLWSKGWQASFHSTVNLQVTPQSGPDFAFGFTFFMIPVNSTRTLGGFNNNLGIYDVVSHGSPVFAVELDNGRGNLNPDFAHIGININSPRSQNLTRFDGVAGNLVTLYLSYYARIKTINVVATHRENTRAVSFVCDLAAILPQQVQVGLSAATSFPNFTDMDAYTWEFVSGMVPDIVGARENDSDVKPYVM